MAALVDSKIIGAVWARIMDDYGHLHNDTPSLVLAVYNEHRGQEIGAAFKKSDPAYTLYKSLGLKQLVKPAGKQRKKL